MLCFRQTDRQIRLMLTCWSNDKLSIGEQTKMIISSSLRQPTFSHSPHALSYLYIFCDCICVITCISHSHRNLQLTLHYSSVYLDSKRDCCFCPVQIISDEATLCWNTSTSLWCPVPSSVMWSAGVVTSTWQILTCWTKYSGVLAHFWVWSILYMLWQRAMTNQAAPTKATSCFTILHPNHRSGTQAQRRLRRTANWYLRSEVTLEVEEVVCIHHSIRETGRHTTAGTNKATLAYHFTSLLLTKDSSSFFNPDRHAVVKIFWYEMFRWDEDKK